MYFPHYSRQQTNVSSTPHVCRQISEKRTKSALLLIIYLISSAIYYIPINVIFILDAFHPEFNDKFYCGHMDEKYKRVFQWISDFLLPCINPIVFYALSSSLRKTAVIRIKSWKNRAFAIPRFFFAHHSNQF